PSPPGSTATWPPLPESLSPCPRPVSAPPATPPPDPAAHDPDQPHGRASPRQHPLTTPLACRNEGTPCPGPPSCSSASTTPAALRWPPATCSTSPANASMSAPPNPSPKTRSTRSPSKPWQ